MKNNKYSTASKMRWQRVSKEDRQERMRQVALRRWEKVSEEDRKAWAMKLVDARNKKDTPSRAPDPVL